MTTMTESFSIAQCTRDAVVRVGGMFMTSPAMAAAARAEGLNPGVLCLRGRVGAAGALDAAAATGMLGSFAPRIVELAFRRSPQFSAGAAATVYAGVCANWGREHLAGTADAEPVAEQAEVVVESADVSELPLVAGWSAWPRPRQPAARLAHALMLLRELRHGLHLAALHTHGLEMPVAVLAAANGVDRLRRLGWHRPDINALRRRAAATDDLAGRCDAAENATDVAFSACLDVIGVSEQRTLVGGLARADEATRLVQ
ncbi:MAG: helix-turn-helix domain-containing protein [Jiangellaceae bacterium]